ncbi:MAG TPA: CRISPR-associated protein Csx3 [Ktedonobacteraceae bacterium]|nr:CRISPR-associated protein Csx3 [Ktedonobacteraceae bacterium]
MMVNLLPTILLGGPPHAGKSVLLYWLSRRLHQRDVTHYAIRACPDGEGNWSQEMDQSMVNMIRVKGKWSPEFVQRICHDLDHRSLPLLVDVGGNLTAEQACILNSCTHSLLLLKADEPGLNDYWSRLVLSYGLQPLARLYSSLNEPEQITSTMPTLEGTITGLQRGKVVDSQVFHQVLERVYQLFSNYSPDELKAHQLEQAQTELVIDVDDIRRIYYAPAESWQASFLPSLLANIPERTAMSVYGPGPQWLYAALAAHAGLAPFYQFDPRLGWIEPIALEAGPQGFSEISVEACVHPDLTLLKMSLQYSHLAYFQAEPLPFPDVRRESGLILDGKLPTWLITALVRFYQREGVNWIARHQPQSGGALVVFSRLATYSPGQFIPLPPEIT